MKEHEDNLAEQELRQLCPAPPPPELMRRLEAARPVRRPAQERLAPPLPFWSLLLRWLVPATAVVAGAVVVWRAHTPAEHGQSSLPIAEAAPAVAADDVELARELIRSFDTVARLPGGEPVRFRCLEWMDEVTVRDKDRSVVIEQRTPRVEVIPVRFETY